MSALPETKPLPRCDSGDRGAHRRYPIFVEEMTKAVPEAESEGEARQTAAAMPSPALTVPASLHASLMAGSTGSATPRKWHRSGRRWGASSRTCFLAVVVRKPERSLISSRTSHCRWFVVSAGRAAAGHLSFQARASQDAAYGTLLSEPRRALHARIAETLESQFAEIAENQPEVLARHFT